MIALQSIILAASKVFKAKSAKAKSAKAKSAKAMGGHYYLVAADEEEMPFQQAKNANELATLKIDLSNEQQESIKQKLETLEEYKEYYIKERGEEEFLDHVSKLLEQMIDL